MFGLNEVPDLSSDGVALKRFITREPISIFSQIKNVKGEEKEEKLSLLLEALRKKLPEGFKVGVAVGKGDCFFDSVAQGLNELKDKGLITSSKGFSVKSLRESCKQYAQQKSSWLNKLLDKESEKLPEYIPRIEFTAEDIKNTSSGSAVGILNLQDAIWGRPYIEGQILCNEYKVNLCYMEIQDYLIIENGKFYLRLEEDGKTKRGEEVSDVILKNVIKADSENTEQKAIHILNYKQHFVPLLKDIEKDIEEYIEISREEVYGLGSHSFIEDTGNHDLEEQKPQVQVQLNQDSFTAIDVYSRLKEVNFDSDDSDNPGVWSGMDQINLYINSQAIKTSANGGELAYYIGPNNFGFDSKEGIEDIAKLICRKEGISNSFYGDKKSLDKPFIVISNTATVLAQSSTDVNQQGGNHWISWVLLPKKYVSLSGKEINNDKYKVLFFDSLNQKSFPEGLKKFLTEGGEITETTDTGEKHISLLPFCTKEEIDFCDLKELTGQQCGMNGIDCGWWAVYYVLMAVYTGGVEFLNPLKGRKLSAVPLRNIMNLQEAIEQESLQNKKNRSSDPRNGEHRSGSINEIQRKSSKSEERTRTKGQNKGSRASDGRLLDEEFEKTLIHENYSNALKSFTIRDIAEHIYGWDEKNNNIIFGVEGDFSCLSKRLEEFKSSKDKILIYIVNKDANHWVTLVGIHDNGQEDIFFYADSFGEEIEKCLVNGLGRGNTDSNTQNKVSYRNKINQYSVDRSSQSIKENSDDVIFVEETAPLKQDGNDNIRMSLDGFLESKGYLKNNIHSVSCKQQGDGYNCGVFALENAKAILNVVRNGDYDTAEVKESLERVRKDPESLNNLREEFAKSLKKILNSTAAKRLKISSGFNGSSKNLFSQLVKKLGLKRYRMACLETLIKEFSKKCAPLYDEMPLSRLLLGQFLCENEDRKDTNKLDKYLLLYPENKSIAFLLISRIRSLVLNIIENKEKASKKDNSTLNLIPKIDILLSNSDDKLSIFDLEKKEASSQVNTRKVSMDDIKKGSEVKCVPVDKMLISTDLLGRFKNEIKFREEVIGKLDEVFDRAAMMSSILMRDPVDCQAVFTGLLMDYCNKVSLSNEEVKLIISSSIGPGISIWLHKNTANNSGYSFALEQQENGIQTKSSSVSNLSFPIASKKVKDVKGGQGEYYAFLNREYKIFSLRADAKGDRAISSRLGIYENREKSIINLKDFGCNDLHLAIAKNKIDSVKKLIVTNEDYIKGCDTYGNTPLHFAVQKDNFSIFDALMGHIETKDQKESYIVAKNSDRYTPLHFVARSGNVKVVEKLLEYVNNDKEDYVRAETSEKEDYVRAETSEKETPLHFAARSGNVKVVEKLLEYVNNDKEDYVRAETSEKETPLHFAARSGNVKVVEELLNHVNDNNKEDYVKSKNTNKCTSLHFAAESGNAEVVNKLLDLIDEKTREAYVKSKNNKGETSLHFATKGKKSNVEVILSLIRCVTEEQEKQKYVTCKNNLGYTPLHLAAGSGNAEVVNKLLDLIDEKTREAYVKSKNNKGETPLHFAARSGNVKVVEELLNHVNDNNKEDYVRAKTSKKETPLHFAARSGNVEVVNKLLEFVGAEVKEDYVKSKNNQGDTPLHFAARSGNVEVVNKLLEFVGAEVKEDYVKSKNNQGDTPLHFAARSGNVEVVNKLLEFVGAEVKEDYVKSKNNQGDTPLHFAARGINVKAVQKLLQCIGKDEKGNYIKFANNDNKNALDIAISYCSWKVFDELLKYIENPKQKQHYLDLAKQASDSEKRNIHSSDNLQTKGCVKERKKQRNSEGLTSQYSKKRPRISDGKTQKPPVKKVAQSDSPRQEVKIKSSVGNDESDEQQDSSRERGPEISSSRSSSSGSQEGEQPTLNDVESNGENQEAFSRSSSTSDENDNNNLSEESGSRSSVDVRDNNDLQDVSLQDDVYEEEDENSSSQSNSSPESLDELQNDTINRSLDDTGGTILHLFVRIHHSSAIDNLINSGADVNATDKRGYTPLHFAAIKGYHEIVLSLMCKGADVNVKDFDGRTPLKIAETKGHTKCIEYLQSNDLHDVSDESLSVNSYSELQEFVNLKYDKEYTSLHLAVKSNNVQDVKSLIAIGADVSIKATRYEYAPLHFAAEGGNEEIVKILIEAGADPNAEVKESKWTALHYAARYGKAEVVDILIKANANLGAKTILGYTPLYFAVKGGNEEIVKILIEAGAGRKAVAEINKTPFSFLVNALDIGTPSP
ncbi:ankyrin repeat domain-containing protein [Wolbachia endosymbiont (group A) of Myopa testacea]|uniref:ankyrin repeat domain-containing protein n=1 Tax=Wolbachia endosymbiont (group A) of Myopa testacea TaxID=3066148 RepID=UPI003340379F